MVAGDGDDVAGDACDEWRAIPGLEPGRGRNGLLGVFRSAGVFSSAGVFRSAGVFECHPKPLNFRKYPHMDRNGRIDVCSCVLDILLDTPASSGAHGSKTRGLRGAAP
jgi:hypothetical protein